MKKKKAEYVTIKIRKELHQWLKKQAEINHRFVTGQIEHFIERATGGERPWEK